MTARVLRPLLRADVVRSLHRTRPDGYGIESLEPRTLLTSLVWSAAPSLPVARGHAAAVSTPASIFLFGGSPASGGSSAVLELDASASAWVSSPSLDQSRVSPGAGATGQLGPIIYTSDGGDYKYASDIFVFGGAAQGQPTATSVNYYPAPGQDNITTAPSMSTARSAFAYATDPATGDLYAIGGLGTSNIPLSSGEFYDENADKWTTIAPLAHPIYNAAAAPDGAGHILVFGGDSTSGAPLDTVYRYTIATNSWDTASSMPMALAQSSALYAAYGQIYLIGGLGASGAVANVETYNPVTDTWADEAPLPAPVYGAAAVIDANQNIQIIGGYSSPAVPLASVWNSPIGPAPVGLPVPPALGFENLWDVYNGAPQPVTPTAVGTDGVTPVAGTFTVTYNGSLAPPTNAGQYNVVANFTSADPGYVNSVTAGVLNISPAQPTITLTGGGTTLWNGQPHPVTGTAVGIDGQTPVAGSFNITYNGSATAPTNAGVYNVLATFTSGDPNYASTTATTTITIPDPTIPTGVKVVGYTASSIEISWNPVPVPISGYIVYERFVAHSPRGSGVSITYSAIASGLTGTSYIIGLHGGTFAVASVSSTGVVSTRSADASGSALYAPSLYGVITSGGAVVSSITTEVGQPTTATLNAYGNLYPTFTMTSGPATMSVNPTTGVISYTPAPSDMGTVYATFVATNSVGSASITIPFVVQGLPTVRVTGGTFDFDGNVHSATAVAFGLDGVTPIAGSFTFTYAPVQYPTARSTSPYAEPGTYVVYATFTSSDPAYGGASGTGMLTIRPAVPGTSGDDTITLVQDADGQHIDWTISGLSGQVLINDPLGLTIDGNGGSDTIVLDYPNGNPLPNTLHLNGTFTVNGLQGSNPFAGTSLDINKSTVYFSYGTSDPIAAITNYLQNGYNSGSWDGAPTASTGVITSSAARTSNGYMIGYADSADGVVSGQPANTVELKYTLGGDLDLTGTVNFQDFSRLISNFGKPASWDGGALTYANVVSFNDFAIAVSNYGKQVAATTATPANSSAVPSRFAPAVLAPADTSPVTLSSTSTRPRNRLKHR
jgi:hypothetical protein